MAKAKLGLSTLTPQEIIELTNQIVTMMTGNPNFATPNPTLAAITTQKNTTSTSITAYDTAKATTEAALVTRDVNVTALKNLLTQLVGYVENVSAGDAAKIESAGMSVRASTGSPGSASAWILPRRTPGTLTRWCCREATAWPRTTAPSPSRALTRRSGRMSPPS